jgi:hypothetical protein
MKNNTVVYIHTRLDTNEVFYVGIGTEKRAYRKFSRSKFWHYITDKVDYRVDILFNSLSRDEACILEVALIEFYGRRNLGKGTLVNLTDGGEAPNGLIHSEETKKKISDKTSGSNNPRYGAIISKETRRKIGEGNTGKVHTKEHNAKIKDSSNKKPVIQLDLEGNFIREWESIKAAVRIGGFHHSCIPSVCRGERKHHKGFKWVYK